MNLSIRYFMVINYSLKHLYVDNHRISCLLMEILIDT